MVDLGESLEVTVTEMLRVTESESEMVISQCGGAVDEGPQAVPLHLRMLLRIACH